MSFRAEQSIKENHALCNEEIDVDKEVHAHVMLGILQFMKIYPPVWLEM
jgi:hypothetical protein